MFINALPRLRRPQLVQKSANSCFPAGQTFSGEVEFGFEEFRKFPAQLFLFFPRHGDRDRLAPLQPHGEQVEDAGELGRATGAGDQGVRFGGKHDDAGRTAVNAGLVADFNGLLIHAYAFEELVRTTRRC